MFDTIKPPTNEFDVKIEEIKKEKMQLLLNKLETIASICVTDHRDGRKLLPAEGTFCVSIGGETITFNRY